MPNDTHLVPPQRVERLSLAERLGQLKADLKSAYIPPREILDVIDNTLVQAADEADPATVQAALVTARLLVEWVETAAAQPWALYDPRHAAGACDDLAALLEHACRALPLLADSVAAAAERGDVPEPVGRSAQESAEVLRDRCRQLCDHGEAISRHAASWRTGDYRGYAIEDRPEQMQAIADALADIRPEVHVTAIQPNEIGGLLPTVSFEYEGHKYAVVDNVDWELSYQRPDGEWADVTLDGPTGLAVHPRWVAEQAVAALGKVIGAPVL